MKIVYLHVASDFVDWGKIHKFYGYSGDDFYKIIYDLNYKVGDITRIFDDMERRGIGGFK